MLCLPAKQRLLSASVLCFFGLSNNLYGVDCSAFQAAHDAAQNAVKSDIAAIKRLGFSTNSSTLDGWTSMTNDQKKKLQKVAIFNFLQAGAAVPFVRAVDGKINLPNGVASISTYQAQALYRWAGGHGLGNDPVLEKIIAGAASITDKPQQAEFGRRVLDTLSTGAQGATSDDWLEATAPIAQTAFTLMSFKNPIFGGYATALGIGSDTLTLVMAGMEGLAAKDQIAALTKINEIDLRQLNNMTAQIRAHVQTLKVAQTRLNTCIKQLPSSGFEGTWQISMTGSSCAGEGLATGGTSIATMTDRGGGQVCSDTLGCFTQTSVGTYFRPDGNDKVTLRVNGSVLEGENRNKDGCAFRIFRGRKIR